MSKSSVESSPKVEKNLEKPVLTAKISDPDGYATIKKTDISNDYDLLDELGQGAFRF